MVTAAAVVAIGSLALASMPAGATPKGAPKGAPKAKVAECEQAVAGHGKLTYSQSSSCVWFKPTITQCPSISVTMAVSVVEINGVLYALRDGSRPLRLHKALTTDQLQTLCSDSAPVPPSVAKMQAGQQYEADVAPLNAAVAAFKSNTDNDLSALPAEVAPIITAGQTFESTVLRQQWPSNVKADIKTVATADGTFLGAVSNFGSSTVAGITSAEQAMVQADSTFVADSNIVRADLGLPAPPA
jgi:hypothetical protein